MGENIKEIIAEMLAKEAKNSKLKREEIESFIEIPPNPEMGDFAFPCFKLSAALKRSPVEIAKLLASNLKIKAPITKVQAQGAYLNFFADKTVELKEVLNIKEDYGKSKEGKGKKVLVDFSSPNVGKPMHVGHVRSTIVGDSIMRTYSFLGYDAVGINYLGDIGLHIGKLIVAWGLWLDRKALEKDPVKEMLRLYVKFCAKEKSEFVEGQDEADDYSSNEWTNKAKEKLKLLELGDETAHKIWKEIREASGKGFDRVYKILKVNFHETTGQSKFGEIGKKIVLNAAMKGLAKSDETGAVYVDLEEFKLPKKFVLRSNGTASYMTQDIGAAVTRCKNYNFDRMIYETDYRQTLHFQQLFAILNKFGYDFYKKCSHVGHGTINFGKEILASRDGRIILLEDVLKKTIEKAKQEIKKRKTKGDPEKIGVASIKYAILRNEPVKDVEFSWDAALNFEGDTGPYLQYSYARASSIIKKAGKTKENKKAKISIPENLEQSEIDLAKKILEFPELVRKAGEQLNPSILANYSFQLSQAFNNFYASCKVIGADGGKEQEAFRMQLVESFRITIKNALYLLGIEVMEEM